MSAYTEIARLGVKIVADGSVYTNTMRGAVRTAEDATRKLTAAGKAMSLSVTAPLVAIGAGALRAFSTFDDAMTKSTSIMGKLSEDMRGQLERTATALSNRGKLGADVLAGAYYELASAGLTAEQSMASLGTVTDFATAGAFDLAKATNLLAGSMGALGLPATRENIQRMADVLTQAGNLEAASPEQFATALVTKSAGAMRLLNKEVEEGVAVLMAYAKAGVKGENAGEKLDVMWRDLASANVKHREDWDKLNIKVFDAAGNFRHTADILADMEKAMAGMSAEQKKVTLLGLGMTDMSMSATTTLLGMSKQIRENQKNLNVHNVVQEVAERQMQSFAAQTQKLQNNITNASREIGKSFLPTIERMVGLVQVAQARWEGMTGVQKQNAITTAALAAAAGPALIAISVGAKAASMMFSVLNTTMTVGMTVARGLHTGYRLIVGGITMVATATKSSIVWVLAEWKAFSAAQAGKAALAATAAAAVVGGNAATATSYATASAATAQYGMVVAGTAQVTTVASTAQAAAIGTTALATTANAGLATSNAALSTGLILNTTATTTNTLAKAANSAGSAAAASSNVIYTTATLVSTTATNALSTAQVANSGIVARMTTFVLNGVRSLFSFTGAAGGASTALATLRAFAVHCGRALFVMALPVLLPLAKIALIVGVITAAVAGLTYAIFGSDGLSAAWTAVKETMYGFYVMATEWLSSIWKGIKNFLGFTEESAKAMDDAQKAAKDAAAAADKAEADSKAALEAATKAQADLESQTKDLTAAMEGLKNGTAGAGDSSDLLGKKAEDLQKRIDDMTKDLQAQEATFGKSNAQQDIYRMKLDGATDAQLKAAQAAADALDVKEKEKKAQEKLKEKMEEGKKMAEQYLTPQEKMAKAHLDLSHLLEIGAIDMETYNRGMKEAKKEFAAPAVGRVGLEGIEGVRSGTAEALQRLSAYRSAAAKPLTDIAAPLKGVNGDTTALAARKAVAAGGPKEPVAMTREEKRAKALGLKPINRPKATAQDMRLMALSTPGGAATPQTKGPTKHEGTVETLLAKVVDNTSKLTQTAPADL